VAAASLLVGACQSSDGTEDMSGGNDMQVEHDLAMVRVDLGPVDLRPPPDLAPPPSCMDKIKNGMETDVDCGGPFCSQCADGKMCVVNLDCMDKVCANGICAVGNCMDHARNGDETDIDCGGKTCPACPLKNNCNVNTDCMSGICDLNTCVGPTCEDSMMDGDETDVDCGGSCLGCGDGRTCIKDTDCANGEVCFKMKCST
jgi:hypothetical protein